MFFWYFLVVCFLIILIILLDGVRLKKKGIKLRWDEVPAPNLKKEDVYFDIDEKNKLRVRTYIASDFEDYKTLPVLLVFQRDSRKFFYMEQFGVSYAFMGYRTFLVGYDKHPKDKNSFISGIVNNYDNIINLMQSYPNSDMSRLCFYGSSWGASAAFKILSEEKYTNNILGMVGVAMPQIDKGTLNIEKLSSKVLLIHAKDDKIVPVSEFENNIANLNLKDDSHHLMNGGGHFMLYQESGVFGKAHLWLKFKAKPVINRIIKKEIELN